MRERQRQEQLKADIDGPIPTNLDTQRDMAKRLWDGAIDMESPPFLDYELSSRCYEKLKKLDPSVRQSNKMIDMELEYARRQLSK